MMKSECGRTAVAEFVISNSSFLRHWSFVIRHYSVFLFIASALATALGQESPTPFLSSPSSSSSSLSSPSPTVTPAPTPSLPPMRNVRLRFALPPLDGTISLGIYDATGKLVRVRHREDSLDDFTPGNDALETDWDGTDDEGKPLPNGKYHARGLVIGDLNVEGVDYFFNDWVTDENSPHIQSLLQLFMDNGELRVGTKTSESKIFIFSCNQNTGEGLRQFPGMILGRHCEQVHSTSKILSPIDCANGKDGTDWYIDQPEKDGPREVKQLSKDNELLRRLSYAANDPQPQSIEASSGEEKIFLIERNDQVERLRALALLQTTKESPNESVSDWKTLFEKKIVAHKNFGLEDGKPVANPTKPQSTPETITQKLRSDPLQNDKPGKVDLAVGIDNDGSFLKTADGLPLRTISDTPNLTRILLSRPNDKTIEVFQDDGAVVEQFRISNLGEMIAFDCGDFELK